MMVKLNSFFAHLFIHTYFVRFSQLKAFLEVGILLTYFAVSWSSLSEDSAEFRYVQLYIADQAEFAAALQKLHITPI